MISLFRVLGLTCVLSTSVLWASAEDLNPIHSELKKICSALNEKDFSRDSKEMHKYLREVYCFADDLKVASRFLQEQDPRQFIRLVNYFKQDISKVKKSVTPQEPTLWGVFYELCQER